MPGIPLHVLVCEDVEDDMLLLLLRGLRADGYAVSATRVEDAAAMRAALAERPWDIVISDSAMPRFSALDALRTLRESGRDLPLIIVSGTIDENRAVEALLVGANDFVSKQSLPRLVPAVQRALEQARSCKERVRAEEALRQSEAQVGVGTTFRVSLPAIAFAATPAVDAARAQPTPAVAATKRGRILVVDDEPLVGKAVSRALSREHDVEVLVSARAALTNLQAGERFDVVLCDLMMPEMTGMDLWTELEKMGGDLASRVIFLTGGACTPQAREFVDATKNLVLDKPFEPKTLRAVVEERVKAREDA